MSTEVDTQVTEDDVPPPVVDVKPAKNGKVKVTKPEDVGGDDEDKAAKSGGGGGASPIIREIRNTEEKALRDWIAGFGLAENAFKVVISRRYPKTAIDAAGKEIKVNGHLDTVYEFIDDEYLKSRFGGGTYTIQVHGKDAGDRWKILKQRDIDIAGDPRTDNLPRTIQDKTTTPAAAVAPTSQEPERVTLRAFDMMEKQMERVQGLALPQAAPQQDLSPIIEMMKIELAARSDEIRGLRADLVAAQNREPPKDEIKDKLLGSLIDGESGRITALRTQHESEIRMMKERELDIERRLGERYERDRAAIVQSHERELATMRSSHEVALSAIKTSFETQIAILKDNIRQNERQQDRIEAENKELRAKKEKSVIETVKDLQVIKDALADDSDEKEESAFDKITGMIANPETLRFAQGLIGKAPPGAPGAPVPVAPRPTPQRFKKQIVRMPDGATMQLNEDGSLQGPLKKKPVVPGEIDLPVVPPEQVATAVSFLEQAYGKRTPPEEVATSVRMIIPAETSHAIAAVGIDVFMNKVAKLPPTSPLATQAGRVWVRQVAKALT